MSSFGIFVLMLGGIFCFFRIIVALMWTAESAFMVQPLNITWEIVTLFITLVCFILLTKKSIIGALLYFISYASYFGVDLYQGLMRIGEGKQAGAYQFLQLFISLIAMIIPLLAFFDIAINKDKKNGPKNRKTDWFYRNEKYIREKDGREDTNQYKI